jgi:hypothetical protein
MLDSLMQPRWGKTANQFIERDVKPRMTGMVVREVGKMHMGKVPVAPA